MTIAIFIAVLLAIIYRYGKGNTSGVLAGFFFLIILPDTIGIKFNDTVPVLTLQRVILILMVFYWLKNSGQDRISNVPYKYLFLLIIAANTVTLVLADYFVASLKSYLSLIVENILVYFLLYTSLRDEDALDRTFLTVFNAITIIALVGLVERQTGGHLLDLLPNYTEKDYKDGWKILANFKHPILLGISLAIGVVLNVYFLGREKDPVKRVLLYLRLMVIGSSLYFTFSRGPWLAAIIGTGVLFVLGTRGQKNKVLAVGLFAAAVMLAQPGTYKFIYKQYQTTFRPDTVEGSSFYYRWELWMKAYQEVSKVPKRLAFGYGLEYHRLADLTGEFKLADKTSGFYSWDNELACELLELGFIGLSLYLLLYFRVIARVLGYLRSYNARDDFLVMNLAVMLVVIFMMTNVRMFSQQIMYIFYASLAVALRRTQLGQESLGRL